MFGLTATQGYIIGGIIADRVSAKLLLLLSLFSSCALTVAMAFVTGYVLLLIIFGPFGVTIPMLQWSAYLKMVRARGSEDQQGRIFSWLEIFGAIIPAIGSYGILAFMENIKFYNKCWDQTVSLTPVFIIIRNEQSRKSGKLRHSSENMHCNNVSIP